MLAKVRQHLNSKRSLHSAHSLCGTTVQKQNMLCGAIFPERSLGLHSGVRCQLIGSLLIFLHLLCVLLWKLMEVIIRNAARLTRAGTACLGGWGIGC